MPCRPPPAPPPLLRPHAGRRSRSRIKTCSSVGSAWRSSRHGTPSDAIARPIGSRTSPILAAGITTNRRFTGSSASARELHADDARQLPQLPHARALPARPASPAPPPCESVLTCFTSCVPRARTIRPDPSLAMMITRSQVRFDLRENVRRHQHRATPFRRQVLDERAVSRILRRVEAARRLIEDQHRRRVHQRTASPTRCLYPSKIARSADGRHPSASTARWPRRSRPRRLARSSPYSRPESQIVADPHLRIQRRRLRQIPHHPARRDRSR